MKTCFKCGKEKDITEFYAHPQMADGHLGKCKDCTRLDVARRERLKRASDSAWVNAERERCRIKAADRERRLGSLRRLALLFPEKKRAHSLSQHVTRIGGQDNHHWSYRPEHAKDIIRLSVSDHKVAHRYMIYDQERMMFRRLDGTLIETREEARAYCSECIARRTAELGV